MAFIRTRAQLIDRLAADVKEGAPNQGTLSTENYRRYLDQAWATVWHNLTDGEGGFGRVTVSITSATASPTLVLPQDFLALHAIARSRGGGSQTAQWIPAQTTWKEVKRLRLDMFDNINQDYYGGYYLWETLGSPPQQALRFFPQLAAGEIVELSYVTQAPSLANSDGTYTDTLGNAEDATITIDLFSEPLTSSVISLARVRLVNRSDEDEYQKALAQLGSIIETTIEARTKQNQGPPLPASAYRSGRRWGVI